MVQRVGGISLRWLMRLRRSDIQELHCITPIANVPSIVRRGILCHERARAVAHISVADAEVQTRRASKRVPGGLRLHEYANLYIDARNVMMYVRKDGHLDLCVLRVSTDVLDLMNVVIADRNAAADLARFAPSPTGLALIDRITCLPSGGAIVWKRGKFVAQRFSCRGKFPRVSFSARTYRAKRRDGASTRST